MNKGLSDQLGVLKQKKLILVMLIFFFVLVITWTMVGLFSSQKKVAISSDLRTLSKPLNPVINEEVLDSLLEKKYYEAYELEGFPIYKVLSTKDGSLSKLVDIEEERDELIVPTPAPVEEEIEEEFNEIANPVPSASDAAELDLLQPLEQGIPVSPDIGEGSLPQEETPSEVENTPIEGNI